MRPLLFLAFLMGSVLLLCAVAPGCNKNEPPLHETVLPGTPRTAPVRKEEKKTALNFKGREGILKGKILYEGDPPSLEPIRKLLAHPDKDGCLKGGPTQSSVQTWFVNKDNHGVANVVVWLEPPEGKYFSLSEPQTNRKGEEVVIDQPHCAFIPHVTTLFPAYYDGTKQVHTGQKLVIRNSAPFTHAVQWDPSPENQMFNQPIPSNTQKEFVLNPQKRHMLIGCGLHSWMHGIIWIFDHPYHAVSNEDGSFEIKDLPTEVELTFKAWHESQHTRPFEQRKLTLHSGENPSVDLKIKK